MYGRVESASVIYLDNNATTRPCEQAVREATDMLCAHWHNPSAAYRPAQEARRRIELARKHVAALIGCKGREIVFTSGGTESVNLAIRGVLALMPENRRTVVTSPIEHEAIRDLLTHLARLAENPIVVRELPIDRHGFIDPADLRDALDGSVALVSLQWANNETGAIQPIEQLAEIARAQGALFHTDATQAAGKLPIDLAQAHEHIDLLTLSAHKFHGIKGAGALFVREGVRIAPTVHGTQELARRGGTESTACIAAMGAAAQVAREWLGSPENRSRVAELRDALERALLEQCDGAILISPPDTTRRLWNTVNVAFPGVRAELLVISLSEAHVCASAGSACASGAMESSPVIEAMTLPEGTPADIAYSAIRFSLSRETTREEIDRAIGVIATCVRNVGRMSI